MNSENQNEVLMSAESLGFEARGQKILNAVSMQLHKGEIVTLIGPNGAGKTTLVRLLLGLMKTDIGRVFRKAGLKIGYVPQKLHLGVVMPLRVRDFLLLAGRYAESELVDVLEQVQLPHMLDAAVQTLSGGELQRILMARSIVRRPKLVMLDEPATGIDAVGEADMYRMLEGYQKESGATLIMITHDWHVATHHADFVLLLNCNQISFGSPREALCEDHLRTAYGHIGHEHELKFLFNSDD